MRLRFRRQASVCGGCSDPQIRRQQSLLDTNSRSGSLFHYYLVYLMLSGTTLAACGLFLHILLKSDYSHDQNSRQMQTLMRMEKLLRSDAADAVRTNVQDGQLVFELPNEPVSEVSVPSGETGTTATSEKSTSDNEITKVRWTFRGHRVGRGVLPGGNPDGKAENRDSHAAADGDAAETEKLKVIEDNFVFLTGTEVRIQPRADHGVTVVIRESSMTSREALPATVDGVGNRGTGLGVVEIISGPGQYGIPVESAVSGDALKGDAQ